jgi:hypothetical protein
MILTIHVLPAADAPTARLTWAETQLVRYLHGLWARQGDVLLFSVRRAATVTGLHRGQIERGLRRLEAQRAVEMEHQAQAMAA